MSSVTRHELDKFQELLDAYGANKERWPEGKADFMSDILTRSDEAVTLLDEATEFDFLLNQHEAPYPSSALLTSILEEIEKPEARNLFGLLWTFDFNWKPAMGMACALFFGITLGITNPDIGLPGDVEDELEAIVFATELESDLELDGDNG